jgi:hypothetical protein
MNIDFEQRLLAVLSSIDGSLKRMASGGAAFAASGAAQAGPEVANDRDLDGKYGNEKVAMNPRDWSGPSMKGKQMSECPPEFLDVLASTCDWFAAKNDRDKIVDNAGNPKSRYDRRTAARARGWAKRLRSGWKPAPVPSMDFDDGFGAGAAAGDPAEDDPFAIADDPFGTGDNIPF